MSRWDGGVGDELSGDDVHAPAVPGGAGALLRQEVPVGGTLGALRSDSGGAVLLLEVAEASDVTAGADGEAGVHRDGACGLHGEVDRVGLSHGEDGENSQKLHDDLHL